MKKKIEVSFPDDFVPPEEFDGVEEGNGQCEKCPMYHHDTYEAEEDCSLLGAFDVKCPIKKFF